MEPPTSQPLEMRSEPHRTLPRFKDQADEASIHVTASSTNEEVPPRASSGTASSSDNHDLTPFVPIAEPYEIIDDEATPYANVRLLTDRSLLEMPSLIGVPYSLSGVEPFPVSADPQPSSNYHDDPTMPPPRRPAFVTITVLKPHIHCRLGIKLAVDAESLTTYISGFRPDAEMSRMLELSPLCVGDMILSVNDTNCVGLAPKEIAGLLGSVEGSLTIAVENVSGDPVLVETMIEKPSIDCKVGLSFRYSTVDGGFLQATNVSGLVEKSFVQPGDRIIMINGERPRTVEAAARLIAEVRCSNICPD